MKSRQFPYLSKRNTDIAEHGQPSKYTYLRKSDRIRTCTGEQFDLRFDEMKSSIVNMCPLQTAFSFWTSRREFRQNHPNVKNEPGEEDKEELERELKMYKPIWTVWSENCIRYTWIGHSTAVIQIGKENILIDPVFSERASFLQCAGPKRFRPPACKIQQLPKIDLVLVSHDHYDHLDEHSLKEINQLFRPTFVAGLCSQDVMPKDSNTVTMDWMQTFSLEINGGIYKITFVPVCHWSRRWLMDYNSRLWGGFVIQTPFKQKLFYSGDTGYCGVFKEIGQHFGPFDLTILPIGAYEPNETLRPQHINPDQAAQIHKELKSKQSLGVHWGTFPLGAQGYFQAKYDLADARIKHGLRETEFLAICHGESVVFRLQ